MTDRERYVNARKEARRYQRKFLAVKKLLDERKDGKWVVEPDGTNAMCSICGGSEDYPRYFCGWCGADMRVKEEQKE